MIEQCFSRRTSKLYLRDAGLLNELLTADVVFYSPVVHTPQVGKAITAMYLTAAMHIFGNESFRYVREVVGESDAVRAESIFSAINRSK